jgi:hypothetical protein
MFSLLMAVSVMDTGEFSQAVGATLGLQLRSSGFRLWDLTGITKPALLYSGDDVWLGISWDFRDRSLSASMGGLYWLRDVMERIVVRPAYRDYVPEIATLDTTAPDLAMTLTHCITRTLDSAISTRGAHPDTEALAVERLRPNVLAKVQSAELAAFEPHE